MKYIGILFLLWGVGYAGAMIFTVKGLPALPCFGFFALGALFLGLALVKGKRNH